MVAVKLAHCPAQTTVDGPVPACALMLGIIQDCAEPCFGRTKSSRKIEILLFKKLIIRFILNKFVRESIGFLY